MTPPQAIAIVMGGITLYLASLVFLCYWIRKCHEAEELEEQNRRTDEFRRTIEEANR